MHGADGLDETVDDELFVVHGKLYGDAGQLGKVLRRLGIVVLSIFEVGPGELVAVHTINGEQNHDRKVWDQQRGVEGVERVEAAKGYVGILRVEEVHEPVLGREKSGKMGRLEPVPYKSGDMHRIRH